jgi:hypothetical protein
VARTSVKLQLYHASMCQEKSQENMNILHDEENDYLHPHSL